MIRYFTIKNFLSDIECDNIVVYSIKNLTLTQGKVSGDILNEKLRKSKVAFTQYDENFSFIKEKLSKKIEEKITLKGYEINFEKHPFQFTTYKMGDFYEWHMDSSNEGVMSKRYFSIVIQLNDKYTGGDLELKLSADNEVLKFENGKGNLFVFLSDSVHRVTSVTSGIRYSLVSWFSLKPIENFKKTLI